MIRSTLVALLLAGATTAGTAAADEAAPRSCACVPEAAGLGASPFTSPERVTGVAPYRVTTIDKRRATLLEGAIVTVAAAPGVSAEWMQRLADDDVAGNVASGPSGSDPLAVPGVAVRVRPAGAGFAITITSRDRRAAEEVLRRAEALASRR